MSPAYDMLVGCATRVVDGCEHHEASACTSGVTEDLRKEVPVEGRQAVEDVIVRHTKLVREAVA